MQRATSEISVQADLMLSSECIKEIQVKFIRVSRKHKESKDSGKAHLIMPYRDENQAIKQSLNGDLHDRHLKFKSPKGSPRKRYRSVSNKLRSVQSPQLFLSNNRILLKNSRKSRPKILKSIQTPAISSPTDLFFLLTPKPPNITHHSRKHYRRIIHSPSLDPLPKECFKPKPRVFDLTVSNSASPCQFRADQTKPHSIYLL